MFLDSSQFTDTEKAYLGNGIESFKHFNRQTAGHALVAGFSDVIAITTFCFLGHFVDKKCPFTGWSPQLVAK